MQESHGQSIFTCLQRLGHPTDRINFQTNTSWHGTVAVTRCRHIKNNGTSESPPSQLLQLHQINTSHLCWHPGRGLRLPPADIQYPQPPWGTIQLLHSHSWSSPDAIFLQTNWKMMVILHRMNMSEVFSAFCLTGTFLGSLHNQKLSLYTLGLPQE